MSSYYTFPSIKPSFVDWKAINNKKGILFVRNRDIVSPCLICFISILFQTFLSNVHTNVLVLSCFLYIQTSEFECLFTLFHLSCPIYKFFLYLFLFKKLNRILYKGCFYSPWHIKHPHTNFFRLHWTLLIRRYKKSNRIYFVNVAIIHSLQFGNINLLSDNSS